MLYNQGIIRSFFSCCKDVECVFWENTESFTSKKTNNRTVLGASRMNAGVQPLKTNIGPSSRRDRTSTSTGRTFSDFKTRVVMLVVSLHAGR
jgi:hypothetical protein